MPLGPGPPEDLVADFTVNVAGTVAAATAFDPDRIADAFWDMHADPPGVFRAEIVFRE